MTKITWLLFFIPFILQSDIATEQLIIFYRTETDQLFELKCLADLKAYAEEENIEFILKDATQGLPDQITTTPAIIFQNEMGRSVYAGRYLEFNTIKNFIRTSRLVSQPEAALEKNNVLAWFPGRAIITAPLKVTALQGQAPGNFDQALFEAEVQKGLDKGMSNFEIKNLVSLKRTDRSFYIDIYPYVDEAGELYINWALFSQFSCIDPVAQSDQPFKISYKKRAGLFEKIGQQMESLIDKQLQASNIGDAYTPVAEQIPTLDWDALGLPLPEGNSTMTSQPIPEGTKLPQNWNYAGPVKPDLPALQFRFQAPLDRYSGEVKQLKGSLQLDEAYQIQSGSFKADTRTMTMGMESLDQKVLKQYLKAKKYPSSSFTFQKIGPHTPLQWGQTTTVAIEGTFQLLKYKRNTKVQALLTPIVNENGTPQILAQVQFSLNITDDYGIEGPDGPDPARKMMEFNMRFILE